MIEIKVTDVNINKEAILEFIKENKDLPIPPSIIKGSITIESFDGTGQELFFKGISGKLHDELIS